MFDKYDVVIMSLKPSDKFCHFDSLLNIQIGSRLIENVDFCFLDHYNHHCESLQLTSR